MGKQWVQGGRWVWWAVAMWPGCAVLAQAPGAPQSPPAAAPPAARAPLPATAFQPLHQVEGISEYRLPNGLQVLLVPDDAKPTTTVNMTYRVGSRHENYGETGMAHLLEHLIFKGTPTHRNLLGEFGKRGLRANGTTWYDRTNYFASFSANDENLRWYLRWQADAMVNSLIAKADLDTEMTVVRNEMESGENNPGRALLQQTLATMYQWHNYGKNTIGARSDVENVDITRLQAFYRQHYQPDNATLIIAGRFDPQRTLAWVREAFGGIPKPARKPVVAPTLDPAQDGERSVTLRRVGGTPQVFVGVHVPPGAHPDFAAAELVAAIFGNAPAGRLHKRLTERQLAAGTFGFAFGLADPGPLFLGAALAPGQDVDVARNELLAAMDAVAAEPITQAELDRARTQWLNDWDNGFNDPEVIGVALSDAIARGDWRLYFLQRDQVKALKLADVQRVAEAHFRRANRTVGTYLPEAQPQRAPAPARLDVAAMVQGYKGQSALAQAEAFEATPVNLEKRTQRGTLSSGLKFALLPKGARGGVVHAQLTLRFGSLQSLKGQETVASALAGLLDKGGAGLDRQQWRDELDRLRAEVRFGTDGQTLSVSISTVRAHLPAVLTRVAAVLRQPALPADALEELRRQALTGLEQQRSEPAALVEQALARHGNPYPRGDLRYVSSHEEAVQDVQGLTVAQVRAFHERFVSAALGEFSAVGDFDTDAVLQALLVGLAGWGQPAAGPLAFERVPQPLVPAVPVRFELPTPDKANAHLLAELRLPLNDRDADYAPLLMANYLFGLSESSRLWTRVREKQGLSYDVRSTMDWGRVEANSRWTVSAIFAPANRPALEAAIRDELQRALRDGFGAQELENGKRGLLNLLRLSRAQDAGLVGSLQQQTLLGRDFKFAQQLDEALTRLTPAQVSAAFRKHIQPEALRWAWAGDWAAGKLPPALPSTLTSVP